VWRNKTLGVYGREKVCFIGINELVKNKKVSKRCQDKADLELLLSAKRRRNRKK
jgi:hypothetical protein